MLIEIAELTPEEKAEVGPLVVTRVGVRPPTVNRNSAVAVNGTIINRANYAISFPDCVLRVYSDSAHCEAQTLAATELNVPPNSSVVLTAVFRPSVAAFDWKAHFVSKLGVAELAFVVSEA